MVDEQRQCTATAKSTGERCQRAAIKGGNVCHVHGGAASQVRKKADERLEEMADSTTATVQEKLSDLESEYENAEDAEEKLAIMSEMRRHWKIILDRTGHHPKETRELTGEDGGAIEVSSDVVTVTDSEDE